MRQTTVDKGDGTYTLIYTLLYTLDCNGRDSINDPAVKQVVVDQTKQWSDMMERHRKEEWDLMRCHLQAQEEVLRRLMETQQQQQLKELEALFERYEEGVLTRVGLM